ITHSISRMDFLMLYSASSSSRIALLISWYASVVCPLARFKDEIALSTELKERLSFVLISILNLCLLSAARVIVQHPSGWILLQ
ncbi:hypothetical protein, partial [Klebsiella pneumoniae]|uniref:hypothetical protein n=1 Tax=Klebsiella pneumoniae TaxID=573 RepID=UPI001D0E0345